ncbi:autoinducer 2 ABC transporter substrate-binding protein [Paenibacillus sp. SEL3]
MYRRTPIIFVLILMLLITSSCEFGEGKQYQVIYSSDTEQQLASDTKEESFVYTIGMVPKATENSYFNQVEDGAREAAKDLGVQLLYEGSPVADTDQQIRSIRNLMARGVDLLAVSANDLQKLAPILEEVRARNIRVITWDSDAVPEAREWFVNMVDPETLGRHLMDSLALQMGEQGQYAVLTGMKGASNMDEWTKWMKIQNEEYYPHMTLVQTVATDDDSQKAYSASVRLLQDYPQLKGLIGSSAVATPAAAQAVLDEGETGQVRIVGLSTPNLMRSYLHNGIVENVTLWSPKKLGYLTVVLAKNLLDGVSPTNGETIHNVGEIRVKNDTVIMGEPLDFTKANVDEYDF